MLLAAGADPHRTNLQKESALHYAAYYLKEGDIVERLVQVGSDVNGRHFRGGTPLACSAFTNNVAAAEALLDHGADINACDDEGDTPLHEALFRQADNVTDLLLRRGATYSTLAGLQRTILHLAAASGGLKTLDILLAAGLSGIDTEAVDK